MGFSGRLREQVRKLLVDIATYDPIMNRTFLEASLIGCTTKETLARIPTRFQTKCMVLPAIGIDASLIHESAPPHPSAATSMAPHFLFVGRLLYWKGLHLVLRAMPKVLQHIPNARLRVVGEGADAPWLRSIAEQCGISAQVDWISQMPHDEIAAAYDNHVAFVFPSLHDSGGLVVLESLAAGLPIICLALGGPGVFVDASCGIPISTLGQTTDEVQHAIANAMIALVEQPVLRRTLSENCSARAQTFSWDKAADSLYTRFREVSSSSRI
jgi:glycosyltransferase involved in cell wall biosynthesis